MKNFENIELHVKVSNLAFVYPDLRNRSTVFRRMKIGNEFQLKDINIDLKHGESLGLLGANGSGKTTLLRLIGGIYRPTTGEVRVHGNVATMFDNGFGLDLESSAITNIKFRGRLLKRSKSEIEASTISIKEFADLGEYWPKPLRTYSTGMLSRFMIGLATAFPSDLLLIDEAIGTSDRNFQLKTQLRFQKLLANSSSIMLATHNQELMENYCTQTLLIHKGQILDIGKVGEIWQKYLSLGIN